MKSFLALLGLLAFVLVLLVKPFEFLSTYSIHAGHAVHAVQTDADPENIAIDDRVVSEFADASSATLDFKIGFWFSALGFLGVSIAVLSFKRKRSKNRQRGLV